MVVKKETTNNKQANTLLQNIFLIQGLPVINTEDSRDKLVPRWG